MAGTFKGRNIKEEQIIEFLAKKAQKNKTFVWHKKIIRDVSQGMPLDMYSVKVEKKRKRERMAEIENVKKRREQRAIEKAQHEEKMTMLARERARAEFQNLEKKEEEFDFYQSKIRSEIRSREGRLKPIDMLRMHLTNNGSQVFDMVELNEMVFKGLTVKEIEGLHDEIKLYMDLDRASPTHVEYWEALMVVCDWELDQARVRGEDKGVHSCIETDVRNFLQGKTQSELEALQSQIESQMRSGTALVVEYWETILKQLPMYKAKACLKEIHTKMLNKHLQRLEQSLEKEDKLKADHDLSMQRRIQEAMASKLTASKDKLELKAMKAIGGMEEGDAVFGSSAEVNLDSQVYWWHDKYRPRKPKYFNRVHIGYEWNKYNKIHYDYDNPPPKFVQGYKFNIFYPDLVDKTKSPTYTIEEDGNNSETCIIKFHAGPPYEDIAFKIVSKEWEISRKKGFKSTFESGTLHLYFNVKRYRYRR